MSPLGQRGRCQRSDGGHTRAPFFMSLRFSRRRIKAAAALPLVYATPQRAAAPPSEAIAPALIAAATKEGQADLQLAEKVGLRTDVSGHSCWCRASRRRAYLFARGAGKWVRAAGITTDRGAEPRTEIRDRISSCRRPRRR